MAYSVGFAGKGGTGKTTMAGLLIKYLVENNKTPVLAVDADSNSNLNEVLGLEVEETLGDAREQMKKGGAPGMTKDIFMEMKVQQAIVEQKGFDLIVMGRPEGAGCYCAANTLLTTSLEKLIDNYRYVIIDNEPGTAAALHLEAPVVEAVQVLAGVLDVGTQFGDIEGNDLEILQRDLEIPDMAFGQLFFHVGEDEDLFLACSGFVEPFYGLQHAAGDIGIRTLLHIFDKVIHLVGKHTLLVGGN